MEVGEVGDAGGEAVGDELRAVQLAQLGDAHQLGEATGAADAGLHQRHPAGCQPFPHFPAPRGELGTAHPDGRNGGQAGMAGQVVVAQRCFGEGHVEVLDASQRPGGVVPVPPAVAEVERHGELVAERFPAVADELHNGPVAYVGAEQHRHLDRSEALVGGDGGLAGDLVEHRRRRPVVDVAGVAGGIRPDALGAGAAEQLVHRQAELAPGEVIQRDVHGRIRLDVGAAAPVVEAAVVRPVVQRSGFDRVGAHHDVGDALAPEMNGALVDHRLDDGGCAHRLADADPPVLVGHLDEQRLLRALGEGVPDGGHRHDEGFDGRNRARLAGGCRLGARRHVRESPGTPRWALPPAAPSVAFAIASAADGALCCEATVHSKHAA